jgi:hypothetical protein
MTLEVILETLGKVAYKHWTFTLFTLESGWLLQPRWTEGGFMQTGRKWYVSSYATQGEIVQTALKAILTAEEHEVRERFKYKGVAIFGPHLDPNSLVTIRHMVKREEKKNADALV